MTKNICKNELGFTLIELVASIAILSIAAISMVMLFSVSIKVLKSSTDYTDTSLSNSSTVNEGGASSNNSVYTYYSGLSSSTNAFSITFGALTLPFTGTYYVDSDAQYVSFSPT